MNKKLARFLITAFVLMGIMASGISAQAQDKPARTFYESLNLSTPEDAVKTFTAAFAKEDFPTVYTILSTKAQQDWKVLFQTFAMEHLVKPDYAKQSLQNIPPVQEWESLEYSFVFDNVMLDAAEHDALLIDLRGEVTLGSSQEIITEDGTAVDVTATVEGIEGDVVFRLVQSPSKRWRVLQVIVPNGDESWTPWVVPEPDKTE